MVGSWGPGVTGGEGWKVERSVGGEPWHTVMGPGFAYQVGAGAISFTDGQDANRLSVLDQFWAARYRYRIRPWSREGDGEPSNTAEAVFPEGMGPGPYVPMRATDVPT